MRLGQLLEQGAHDGVFPLGRAEVWHEGQLAWAGGVGDSSTVFDVASLTKVMSTTALILSMEEEQPGLVDAPIGSLFPQAKVKATVKDLLFHRSGLPAFLPYFAAAMNRTPHLFGDDCPAAVRAQVRSEVLARVLATPTDVLSGHRAVYSDVGFIILGAALEHLTHTPLDVLFETRVAKPFNLDATSYRRLSTPAPLPAHLAATGPTRPREPAPGQEGQWNVPERKTREGEVDDDNAWVLDGVSGHAGLFATAHDVARFGQAMLDGAFQNASRFSVDTTSGSTRSFGFDTPGTVAPSCGRRFGTLGRRGALGHTGFTGTSLWVDVDRRLVVALLTNRVALGRHNVGIRDFRPRFHDAVLDAFP